MRMGHGFESRLCLSQWVNLDEPCIHVSHPTALSYKEANSGISEGRLEMWNNQFYAHMATRLYVPHGAEMGSGMNRANDLRVKCEVCRAMDVDYKPTLCFYLHI